MTKLAFTLSSQTSVDDCTNLVGEIRTVKLFFVSTGRNAWWTTWITKYTEGCIHPTFESARQFCEKRRTQGTVFYITELPAIAFVSGQRALLVSEINTLDILGAINADELKRLSAILPVSTLSLRQIYYVFRFPSPLWPKSTKRRFDSIGVFGSIVPYLIDFSTNDPFVARSSSVGDSNYPLLWSERQFPVNSAFVVDIVRLLLEHFQEPALWYLRKDANQVKKATTDSECVQAGQATVIPPPF